MERSLHGLPPNTKSNGPSSSILKHYTWKSNEQHLAESDGISQVGNKNKTKEPWNKEHTKEKWTKK